MFPFWDVAIAPVFGAVGARRVVEIGALRGETTVRMLEALGPDAELHVVDPVPEFDPGEHEAEFPGRYIFHRDLSLNVLSGLPAMDVALIDGDHNWYTVYNELRQLVGVSRRAGVLAPVMILHDVGWPYGRRDLYYAPDTIPEEFRQKFAQRGIRRGQKKLAPRGGLNPTLCNAVVEGGPCNGVMTGLDDWMAEHDRPLRLVVLPIYFGLAIVAEKERLEREPELVRVLDYLESAEGRGELLDLAEGVYLDSMVFQHNVVSARDGQIERAAARYLGLLKGALLDEHYLENELRLHHLAERLASGKDPQWDIIRDPSRFLKERVREALANRRAGIVGPEGGFGSPYFPFTAMGRVALDGLEGCLDEVRRGGVAGDLVECGTGRGGGAIFLRGYLDAYELGGRKVFVADEFRAAPVEGSSDGSGIPFGGVGFPDLRADLNMVRDGFDRFGLLDKRVRFLQGRFEETLGDAPIEQIALLRVGGDAAGSVADVLDELYDRVSIGGFVVVEGYSTVEVRDAVYGFRARRGIVDPVERIGADGVRWCKSEEPSVPRRRLLRRRERRDRAPLAPPTPGVRRDLSVVVVFFDMRREAERTLFSLSRSYQQGVEDLDYEVIVVDNGSGPEGRLGEELVASFGPEFRYIDMGSDAPASPVEALNRGIREAGGENFALMIDGAHVLTPGVLNYGTVGLRTYEPTIVATQQWYVGPGQQGEMMVAGYDQAYEDKLFDEIEWPHDGYRLFEISHFIGDRDWFDGIWESNCLFAPRALLEQVGCFDESFDMPGGGYANLDLYERLGASPDVNVTTILGEGSFHQVHGGTTTNQAQFEERRRRVAGYAEHFAELRGRIYRGPGKPMQYVGTMRPNAHRTKARRRMAAKLFDAALPDPDGIPEEPAPIPEELCEDFIEAFWRSLAWRDTTWLGRKIDKAPTDLIAYQELVTAVRPDWIIETRTANGGRALFFATICELLGHGQVVSIDTKQSDQLPQHPRITYLTGNSFDEAVVAEVRDLTGADPHALVLLGARGSRQRTLKEFGAYAPFVPTGSYLVIEDTIVNGHPVWPSHGGGPMEAVKAFMNVGEFAPDPAYEKYGLTFNPKGFLKRIKEG